MAKVNLSFEKKILAPPRRPAPINWRKPVPYVVAILTLLLVWELAAQLFPGFVLPGVPAVLGQLVVNLGAPKFVGGVLRSLMRLAYGYPTACVVGAGLGVLAGLSRGFAVYLRSVISVLQSIPPITWVPFLAILLGFNDWPIILVIIIASFFPMALTVMNATEGVQKTHLELAAVLGASRRQLLAKVYLPEVFPAIVTGAQVAFGNAWRALIASEMVGGVSVGLGWSISYAGEIADMKSVLAGIVLIGLLATFLDHVVLELVKRRLLRWRYVRVGETASKPSTASEHQIAGQN